MIPSPGQRLRPDLKIGFHEVAAVRRDAAAVVRKGPDGGCEESPRRRAALVASAGNNALREIRLSVRGLEAAVGQRLVVDAGVDRVDRTLQDDGCVCDGHPALHRRRELGRAEVDEQMVGIRPHADRLAELRLRQREFREGRVDGPVVVEVGLQPRLRVRVAEATPGPQMRQLADRPRAFLVHRVTANSPLEYS